MRSCRCSTCGHFDGDFQALLAARKKELLSPTTASLMVLQLICAASKTWRRLKGTNQLPKVIAGVRFENGIEAIEVRANHSA
jgi:putative transposase